MLLLRWVLNTLVLYVIGMITPGIDFASTWSLFVTAVILGLLNAIIRPILLILTLPINILSLGFFTLIINGFIFWLASTMVRGFEIADFAAAFWGALLYSVIIMIINLLDADQNEPVKARAKSKSKKN